MAKRRSSFLIRLDLSVIFCTFITPCEVFAELSHRPLEVTIIKHYAYRQLKVTPDFFARPIIIVLISLHIQLRKPMYSPVLFGNEVKIPVSYTHLTLPTNREV